MPPYPSPRKSLKDNGECYLNHHGSQGILLEDIVQAYLSISFIDLTRSRNCRICRVRRFDRWIP